MAYYDYDCPKCGTFEVEQPMSAPPLEVHDACGSPVERTIPRTAVSTGKGSSSSEMISCQPGGCARPGCPSVN